MPDPKRFDTNASSRCYRSDRLSRDILLPCIPIRGLGMSRRDNVDLGHRHSTLLSSQIEVGFIKRMPSPIAESLSLVRDPYLKRYLFR